MRWLVLLVVVVIALLFWYDPGGLVPKWGTETPISPTPTQLIVRNPPLFPTIYVTPIPPAEKIKGCWRRIGNLEQLCFKDDGNVERIFGGSAKLYPYHFDDSDIIINWHPGPSGHYSYQYKFIDESLILMDGMGNRFIYLRDSEELEHQASISLGPNPVTIAGRLVGPDGVLAEQPITLERYTSCSVRLQPATCKKEEITTILTDSTGQYKFLDVQPQYDYGLSFVFNVVDPDQIPDDAQINIDGYNSFVLSKDEVTGDVNNTISAASNIFYLKGFESGQMKIIDFIYPSTPPPTVTPLPATATPTLDVSIFNIPTLVPTSTPTVQPTPPISVQVRPRSQETTVGTPLLASMILEYYGENYTPEYLRELFIQKGKEAIRYPGNEKFYEEGGIFQQDMLDGVKSLGYEWKEDCQPISGDEEFNQRRQSLLDSLNAKHPVLIGLWSGSSGYNVIVIGYDLATQMYTYLDPEQVSVSEDKLKQLWRQDIIKDSKPIKTEERCIISTFPKS